MQNSNIEWTDHTLNFWWGCTKVSPACTHCYAEQVAKVFGKRLFGTVPTWGAGQPRFQRLEAARKKAIKLNNKPRICTGCGYVGRERTQECPKGCGSTTWRRHRVFVNSMSDWLDPEVPIEWLAYLLETIHLCPNLDFQLLTKRPENWIPRILLKGGVECMAKHDYVRDTSPSGYKWHNVQSFYSWLTDWTTGNQTPPNVWIGTTVEDQTRADQRLPHLLEIPASIRFLSCEPLLGPVDLKLDFALISDLATANPAPPAIHWVIAGGESGGQARPTHPDWFRSLRDQCAAAHVPFFFKQWGEFISVDNMRHIKGRDLRLDQKYRGQKFEDDTLMLRAGTDHTGRLLDGHLHDQFPKV